jgi:DNA polymerase III epsilon subunit-like protein
MTLQFDKWLQEAASTAMQNVLQTTIQNITRDALVKIQNSNIQEGPWMNLDEAHISHYITHLCHDFEQALKFGIMYEIKSQNSFIINTANLPKHSSTFNYPQITDYTLLHEEKELNAINIANHLSTWATLQDFNKLVFLDLETDGNKAHSCNILQIALIVLQPSNNIHKRQYNQWHSYIKPHSTYQVDTSNEAFRINKITQEQIEQAPSLLEVSNVLLNILDDSTLVGFNINEFDLKILTRELNKINKSPSHIYTIDLAQAYWKYNRLDLTSALIRYKADPIYNAHNALFDSFACINLMVNMIQHCHLPHGNKLTEFLESEQNHGRNYNSFIIGKNISNISPMSSFSNSSSNPPYYSSNTSLSSSDSSFNRSHYSALKEYIHMDSDSIFNSSNLKRKTQNVSLHESKRRKL